MDRDPAEVLTKKSMAAKIVSVARLSSKRPEEQALSLKLQALVEPTLKEVWPIVKREGTLETAVASAVFTSKIGSAIAGTEDEGRHALWDDIIRKVLPTADVLLVFGVVGFVLDLPSRLYAMKHAEGGPKVMSRFETSALWLVTREEILTHVELPSLFFSMQQSGDHLSWGSLTVKLEIGSAMESEHRRYEGMVRAPADALEHFGISQAALRQRQVTQASSIAVCPLCELEVGCSLVWELVTHLLATHKRDDDQPRLHGGDDHSAVKQALAWVNRHLVAAKSPLAVPSVLDEYDRCTCANVVNNNSAAVRSIIKGGNRGKKGTPAANLLVVRDNAKCPCFDSECPAPAPGEGRWVRHTIAHDYNILQRDHDDRLGQVLPSCGHLAFGKNLTKAPNAFDADRLLKTPIRGWFTPAQIKAMQATELNSSTGHVWIWFDPYNGKNLVKDAETGPFPRKTNENVVKLMREYHGLNRNTVHELEKTKKWAAGHGEHYKEYQHNCHRFPAGQITKERKLDNRKALRALGLAKKADMSSRAKKNANLQSAHEHTLQQLLRSKLET